MKRFIISIFTVLAVYQTSIAQNPIKWTENNVQFTMPESGIPGKHTESTFEWTGTLYKVNLYFSKRGFDLDEAAQATIRAGKEVGVSKVEREKNIETATMKGVYFIGNRDGKNILFAGLLNPKLKRGIFVDIEFDGDKEKVLPILQTFLIEK